VDVRVLTGRIECRAALLGGAWTITGRDDEIAAMELHSKDGEAAVHLADGTDWRITADGWGLIRVIEAGVPFIRATRDPAAPDRWRITGPGIDCRLARASGGLRRWELISASGDELGAVKHAIRPRNQLILELTSPTQTAVAALVWMALVHGGRFRPGHERRPARQRQEPSADGAL
jgi:hypothetical protein